MTYPVLLFEICYNLRPQEEFFEKLPFLDPHLFGLTSRIFDDTFFGGTDESPY